jgi:hypothetical protein
MAKRGEINIALGLASRAFDLKPWVAAIDGLIYRLAWIDGAAVAPHLFVPRLAREVVGLPDQRLALAPLYLAF